MEISFVFNRDTPRLRIDYEVEECPQYIEVKVEAKVEKNLRLAPGALSNIPTNNLIPIDVMPTLKT